MQRVNRRPSGLRSSAVRAFLVAVAAVAVGNALESCLPADWPRPQLDLVALAFFTFRYRASDASALACALALVDTLLEPRLLGALMLLYLLVVQLATLVAHSELRESPLARTLLIACACLTCDIALSGRVSPAGWLLTWLLWLAVERGIRKTNPPAAYRKRWGWT